MAQHMGRHAIEARCLAVPAQVGVVGRVGDREQRGAIAVDRRPQGRPGGQERLPGGLGDLSPAKATAFRADLVSGGLSGRIARDAEVREFAAPEPGEQRSHGDRSVEQTRRCIRDHREQACDLLDGQSAGLGLTRPRPAHPRGRVPREHLHPEREVIET